MRPQYLVIPEPKNQWIEMPEMAENSEKKKTDKGETKLGHGCPGQARKPHVSEQLNGKMILYFLFVFGSWTFLRRKSTLVLEQALEQMKHINSAIQ